MQKQTLTWGRNRSQPPRKRLLWPVVGPSNARHSHHGLGCSLGSQVVGIPRPSKYLEKSGNQKKILFWDFYEMKIGTKLFTEHRGTIQ